jgi:hypothetical protein
MFFAVLIAMIAMSSPITTFGGIVPIIPDTLARLVQTESLLIDDFSKSNGVSSFGTQWRMFTDQVMGGISTGKWDYKTIDGRKCVQLSGDVSLANNGGFIQIALPLTRDGWPFDASSFKGVRLWAQGNGEAYHIHLRSNDSRLPWQYYGAKFVPDRSWQKYDIPFSDFVSDGLEAELKTQQLTRIAVVAIKKKFKADIAVARLEFYR